MGALLLLGLALSLDSFRVSLALGALRPSPWKQAQITAAFGLCDGLAPLLGVAIGQSLIGFVSGWSEYLGPALLAAYGAFVIWSDWHWDDDGSGREPGVWIVLGLPVSLSLDNLIAGTSLSMTGLRLPLCIAVIGGCSALAALAGLRIGRLARLWAPLDRDWIGGAAMIAVAAILMMEAA